MWVKLIILSGLSLGPSKLQLCLTSNAPHRKVSVTWPEHPSWWKAAEVRLIGRWLKELLTTYEHREAALRIPEHASEINSTGMQDAHMDGGNSCGQRHRAQRYSNQAAGLQNTHKCLKWVMVPNGKVTRLWRIRRCSLSIFSHEPKKAAGLGGRKMKKQNKLWDDTHASLAGMFYKCWFP